MSYFLSPSTLFLADIDGGGNSTAIPADGSSCGAQTVSFVFGCPGPVID